MQYLLVSGLWFEHLRTVLWMIEVSVTMGPLCHGYHSSDLNSSIHGYCQNSHWQESNVLSGALNFESQVVGCDLMQQFMLGAVTQPTNVGIILMHNLSSNGFFLPQGIWRADRCCQCDQSPQEKHHEQSQHAAPYASWSNMPYPTPRA